jgi:hypothetical protein
MPPQDVQTEIVAAYRAGTTAAEIRRWFGVNSHFLYKTLRAHGVNPDYRGKQRAWKAAELDRIAELRRSGATIDDLKTAMGAGHDRVVAALEQLGLVHSLPRVSPDRVLRGDGKPYVRLTPDDQMWSMASRDGWVSEARLNAAQALGRPLGSDEQVRHRDGDRLNCRPENLKIIKR